jgi:hypothetical protein
MLAGACSFTAIAEWAADADAEALAGLGVAGVVPSESTFRPTLQRPDANAFDDLASAWVAQRTTPGPGARRVIAVDEETLRDVPVKRCRQLIADVTGAQVSAEFIHGCLAKAAEAVADVVKLIKTLITAAAVAEFEETTLRSRRDEEVRARRIHRTVLGVLPRQARPGLVPRLRHAAGLRGRGGVGPRPDPRLARRQRPGPVRDPRAHSLITEFRHAVLAGLSDVPRIPGPRHSTAQHPGRDMLELRRDCQDHVLRFTRDTTVWPTNNISEARHPAAEDPAEDLRAAHQRRRHPVPARHPRLHRHSHQARPGHPDRAARCHHQHAVAPARAGLAMTASRPSAKTRAR